MDKENDLWDCDKKINNKIVLVSDETFELGRKQGALEGEIKGYKNIIICLTKENKRFKEKQNPFINNSELEQFTREQIQEIKRFIKELEGCEK